MSMQYESLSWKLLGIYVDRAQQNRSDPSLTLSIAARRLRVNPGLGLSKVALEQLVEDKLLRCIDRGVRPRYEITMLGLETYDSIRPAHQQQEVDSSAWTGLFSDYRFGEKDIHNLRVLLAKCERDLDQLTISNQEKALARAYIVAAKVLADAPEPPADLIWELVDRANGIAGIAALFVAIMALFQGMVH